MGVLRRLAGRILPPRRAAGGPAGSPDPAAGSVPRTSAAVRASYAPQADGRPDPGEVVWAWVAYEDDPSQGKDRPVLLLGRDPADERWLGLQLTSRDHDVDAADEARWGRYWMDVGVGGWDRDGRPSEVRLDRLLRLDDEGIRREGAALDADVFDAVVTAAGRFHDLA